MKIGRLSSLCLVSVCFVACATAQDAGTGLSGGGSNSGGSSANTGGGSAKGGTSGAFGGSSGLPGSGGSTGHAGTGAAGLGSSGASGAGLGGSGTAGGGGAGGSTPVFDTGVCATAPTMSLSYKTGGAGQKISAQYQFSNTSDTPIPVAQLKIRYFFTDEETSGWNTAVYSAQIDGGTGGYRDIKTGVTLTVVKLSAPLTGADSYVELAFTNAATLEKAATASVSWDMQPKSYNAPDQVQADDYSFNAGDIAFTPWDHVAIYQGNTLVFGCVPQSSTDGSAGAGAGGDTGVAGDTGAAGAAGAP